MDTDEEGWVAGEAGEEKDSLAKNPQKRTNTDNNKGFFAVFSGIESKSFDRINRMYIIQRSEEDVYMGSCDIKYEFKKKYRTFVPAVPPPF